MFFVKSITKFITKFNVKQEEKFTELLGLKGESIFETFKNVTSYNNLKKVKLETKDVGKGLKRKERKQLIQELNQEIDNAARTLSTNEERAKATKDFSQKLFDMKLDEKVKRGKSITFLDRLQSENPKFRKFLTSSQSYGFAAALGFGFNKNNIEEAHEKFGTSGMTEEIAKVATRYSVGMGIIRGGASLSKNLGTTTTLYLPKGGKWVNLAIPFTPIFACIGANTIFNKLWQTDYDKYKAENG